MKPFFTLAAATLFLASCATTPTTQSRIAKNGGMYSLLSSEHRRLVSTGQIAKGMSKDAVYLAWGTPSKVFHVEDGAGQKERWLYTRSKPSYRTSIGIGYGGYRRYGYRGGIDCGPRTVNVPEKVGEVVFVRDKVASWERKK